MAPIYSRIGTLTLYPQHATPAELDTLADSLLHNSPTKPRGRRPKSQTWRPVSLAFSSPPRRLSEIPLSALSKAKLEVLERAHGKR